MNLLLASNSSSGLEITLVVAIVILSVIIAIASVVAAVLRIILFFRYHKYNTETLESGKSAKDATRELLDKSGLTEVKVEKCGFFRAVFYGNSYSKKTKTIYLRKGIIDKNTVTAVGVGLQKVGLAIQDRDGDKQFNIRAKLQPLFVFAPFLFIPIVLVGAILDVAVANATGVGTLVSTIIATVFYLVSLVFTFSTIKVEKKANQEALAQIKQANYMTENEIEELEKVFNSYIIAYIADFIITLLEFIRFILKVILKLVQKK